MASHSPYPHPPGPSSYYQPSPPPLHVYGNHSPGPQPPYYHYPGPPPPHMNPHPAGQYQHPPPPTRGRGSYGGRGGHYHHNYRSPQPQSPYGHTHPSVNVHPPPQHGQHHPYSPQSAKYNQPYSPSYHYPSPTAPVFTPSWQQQPISPLPKQLSMPPPQNIPQPFYEPPSTAPPPPQANTSPQSPPKPSLREPEPEIEGPAEVSASSTAAAASETLAASSPTPQPQTSTYAQMGTIATVDAGPSPSDSAVSKSAVSPTVQWAIWSRRPHDPSHAPGIIISPRARPPPDVVHQALDLKTPPPSPPASPAPIVKSIPIVIEETSPKQSSPSQSIDEIAWSSQSTSSVPSSSVTETTDTPTVPGSPASSHTSISVTVVKDAKEVSASPIEADAAPAIATTPVIVAEESMSTTPVVTPEAALEAEAEQATKEESPAPEMAADAVVLPPAPLPAPTTAAQASPTPTPAPASTPAVPKKSWASLLQTPASSSSSSPRPTRNALPTSQVVGFSVPAGSASPSSTGTGPNVPVSPSKKSELVTLLTTGALTPSVAAGSFASAAAAGVAPAPLKIRPRGLVNSGNMCFANSVLQILVYCPPFHRLFLELGRLLVGPVVGANGPVNGASKDVGDKNTATPLVDATATFLREFVEEKKRGKDRARLEVVVRNGASGSGAGRGKGKEKAKEGEAKQEVVLVPEEEGEDDWDGDSFLPTYVYDAMKVKKRFEHMGGGHQEDAEEFFGFYLDSLEEELLSILNSVNPPRQPKSSSGLSAVEEKEEAPPAEDDGWLEVGKRNRTVVTRTIKATESPITRIFGGKFRSTLRAPGQKDSVIVEDWRSLRLDIQRDQIHTIQDALSYISHPQPVQVTQATKPGVTIEAHQQVLIEALPPILVLHMKRFCYDAASGAVVKVGKHVSFGPELEIGPDVMVPAAKKQPTRYKLFGALYHHGQSASGGHYTLDVLHPNRYPSTNPTAKPREGWVRIDDELVSDVRPDDVFNAPERDDSRCAYLLFYRRI
ncbi:unnamed protein product [Cyclocybe aegerita]|uniref:ubiquitinyl hydrolase 1 n=1 Tax=Cyclocybe aegerita TaxID=1973307 RepID=A0A8S0W135_CYCAE|nr:unnamed protein product [Cyclocybe aegerita]